MAREAKVPLMFTLSQLSYWSAMHPGDTGIEAMKIRGRMQKGMVADITVFDPETVRENSGYKAGKNGLPTTGIPFVIVNGTIVVKDSKVLRDVNPGQPIRFPVQENGRQLPLNKESWLNT